MTKFIHNFYIDVTTNNVAEPWGLFFQDNATPQMEELEELHNNIMFYLSITLFAVSWIMLSIILNYREAKISNPSNHGTLVESNSTITPVLILVLIAFPSFKLLYFMDQVIDPSLDIYGEGHQWYWSYQYPDFSSNGKEFVKFDSYIVPDIDLEIGSFSMDNLALEGNVGSLSSVNAQNLPEKITFCYYTGQGASGNYIGTYLDNDPAKCRDALGIWMQGELSQGRISDVKVILNGKGVWKTVFICTDNPSVLREVHHPYIWGVSVPNVAGLEGEGERIFIQSRSSAPAPKGFK